MRITFLMTYASMSGGTRVIATHAQELIRRGHTVQVFSTPARPPTLSRTISSLIRNRKFPQRFDSGPNFFDNSGVPHTAINKFRPLTDRDLPDADVVIATWWETAQWVADLSPSKGAKAFFIQHYETWGGSADRVDDAWRLPLQKIVISRWLEDLAQEKFGDSEVFRVPNSVDLELFNAPPRKKQARPTVGMLYNRLWIKGCRVALRAIEQARQSLPELELVSFGEKPPSQDMPLPAGSRYTVSPPQNAIRDLYAQCDAWLCGSRSEGFHLPPLEAMACRCPVVSTKVGGPMDVIEEGRNGYLVDVDDHAALAERMLRVLRLPDAEWLEMSDSAYATACRYTWQDAAILMEKALEAAIGRSSAPRARGLGVG
jgi:glycosyltransferase involved in cell wall biosynthesis